MDIKTISVAFVAIMVGAVAFGAMLPIFQDVTATEDTFTNEGYFRMSKITDVDTEELTIIWDHTHPGGLTINDSFVPISADVTVSVLPDSNFTVRMGNVGTNLEQIQWYNVAGGAYTASIATGTDMRISCVSGTATATVSTDGVDSTPRTANYTILYYPDINGPYTLKKANAPAYLNGDSDIFGCGTTNMKGYDGNNVGGSQSFGALLGSNLDDGITVTEWRNTTSGLAVFDSDSIQVSYTEVNNYEDLYTLSDIKFKVVVTQTVDDETYTTDNNVTYSYFVVPYEVTAERSVHGDSGFNTIVNLIPLVIGMGLLLIAVWWFVVRKF